MAEFRLSPAAERDLEGIWRYTREEWGLEQSDRYLDMLTATFQALAETPKSARLAITSARAIGAAVSVAT
jgi:toxin ParE1/3/4